MRPFIPFTFILLAVVGCKSNNELATAPAETQKDTVVVMVEKPVTPRDSLVIAFEKTPCFGRCPVYKVKVYESGFAVYEGINFSEKLGMYATTLSKEKIERIYQSALEIDFFELDAEYDNSGVSDLPATITMINMNGRQQKVKARYNAPEKLQIFQENLAVTLSENNWQPYSLR